MGSAKRSAKRAAKEAWATGTGTTRGGGRPRSALNSCGAQQALFTRTASVGARTHPFGMEGPALEVQRRMRSTVELCVHGFWLLVMLGSLLVLGHDTRFCMLCHWSWVLFTLFSAVTLIGNWAFPRLEAWLLFWTLPMLHGLLWLQIVLISGVGEWPGTLWGRSGDDLGSRLLLAQLGTVPLLVLPLLALLGYMWAEREFLLVIFYDFRSQLLPEHRACNLAWCVFSPAIPLAVWAYLFNPTLYADLPRWPGAISVALLCVLCNGPLLYYCHHRTIHFVGAVRWMPGAWLVWSTQGASQAS